MKNVQEFKSKFVSEIEEADWSMLAEHYKRDALFLVDGSLDLCDVAVALAMDKKHFVEHWLSEKLIDRPSEKQVESWETQKFKKFTNFLIIQPYVIAQIIPDLKN